MDLRAIVDLLSTISLIGGLVFAGVQLREARRESRRQGQVQVLRGFESLDFLRAMRLILALPDDTPYEGFEERLGPGNVDLVWFWLGAMESIGILVHDRFVDLHDVDETYGGPVVLSFRKLRAYVTGVRQATGRESMHEWFEWLADQTARLEQERGREPAHVRERDWRP